MSRAKIKKKWENNSFLQPTTGNFPNILEGEGEMYEIKKSPSELLD